MPSISPAAMKRTDVTAQSPPAARGGDTLLHVSIHYRPIATLTRLLPLVVVLVLCTAWYGDRIGLAGDFWSP